MPYDLHPGPVCPRHLVGFDLRRRPHLEADVLVIGAGVAGYSAAIAAADAGAEVLLLCKAPGSESNTAWAQGGVAAVLRPAEAEADDTVALHTRDTLAAGAGLCDETVVRDLLTDAASGIDFLRKNGCNFDRDEGHIALTREGGHSARRILHANGDSTGAEIARALAAAAGQHPRITVIDGAFAIDLITDDDHHVVGVLYHRRDELVAALARATVLATGGCGRVWRETTNPPVATGDGLAMAYRAGAKVADVEFMQFHPTSLYIAGRARLLISEAMRGEGAVLKNQDGERFMPRYHPDAELAPRDVVTRAIIAEVRRTGYPHVWLDATHLGKVFLRHRFPTIYESCAQLGIDISTAWVPVHPSAHYHCGGIVTDAHGQSSLPGLHVAGEAGCTGLHGANRLASNSLLEGLVVGLRSGKAAAAHAGPPARIRVRALMPPDAASDLDIPDLVRSLRALMWRQVGIERTAQELSYARRSLAFWLAHQARGAFHDRAGWELQNMLTVGLLVATAAEARTASVGTHTRSDAKPGVAVDTTHRAFTRPLQDPDPNLPLQPGNEMPLVG